LHTSILSFLLSPSGALRLLLHHNHKKWPFLASLSFSFVPFNNSASLPA
jgi:hypothetical protein